MASPRSRTGPAANRSFTSAHVPAAPSLAITIGVSSGAARTSGSHRPASRLESQKPSGITPATSYGRPSTWAVRPTMSGAAPQARRQSAAPSRRGERSARSPAVQIRPRCGATPATAKNAGVTACAPTLATAAQPSISSATSASSTSAVIRPSPACSTSGATSRARSARHPEAVVSSAKYSRPTRSGCGMGGRSSAIARKAV